MSGVTSGAVGGYEWWLRLMEWDVEALWVSSSNEVPEAALLDTSRRQAAGPLAKCLSTLDQTEGRSK